KPSGVPVPRLRPPGQRRRERREEHPRRRAGGDRAWRPRRWTVCETPTTQGRGSVNAPQPRESPAFRRGEEVNPEDLPLRESVRLLPRVRVPAGQKRTAALVCCVGVQRTGAALRYGWWGRPWGGPGVVHLNVGPGQEQVAPLRVNWEGGETLPVVSATKPSSTLWPGWSVEFQARSADGDLRAALAPLAVPAVGDVHTREAELQGPVVDGRGSGVGDGDRPLHTVTPVIDHGVVHVTGGSRVARARGGSRSGGRRRGRGGRRARARGRASGEGEG